MLGPPRPFTYEQYVLAATLLEDAILGKDTVHSYEDKLVRAYRLYNNVWLSRLLQSAVALILFLAIIEPPNDNPRVVQPPAVTLPIELLCLMCFTVRLVHLRKITLPHVFWRDAKNVGLVLVLSVSGWFLEKKKHFFVAWCAPF